MVTDEQLTRLAELVQRYCGLRITESRYPVLRNSVQERMRLNNHTGYETYERSVQAHQNELHALVERLTIHETSFFRHQPHFAALAQTILPELVRKREQERRLSIWSAACSSGEEAYSLAISALEALPAQSGWEIEVTGTDISDAILAQARSGRFPLKALANLDERLVRKYFRQEGEMLVADSLLQSSVRFVRFNLLDEPGNLFIRKLDLISCQNVLMYFGLEQIEKIIDMLHCSLAGDGYLLLGYAETLWKIPNRFSLIGLGDTFVYQIQKSDGNPNPNPRPPASGSLKAARSNVSKAPVYAAGTALSPVQAADQHALLAQKPEQKSGQRHDQIMQLLAAAAQALERSEYLERERVLRQAEQLEAEHPAVLLALAQYYADLGQIEQAVQYCKRVLIRDGNSSAGYLLAGRLYLEQKRDDEAIRSFRTTIYLEQDGLNAILAHLHLATLNRRNRQSSNAAREYRNVIRLIEQLTPNTRIDGFSTELILATCRKGIAELAEQSGQSDPTKRSVKQ